MLKKYTFIAFVLFTLSFGSHAAVLVSTIAGEDPPAFAIVSSLLTDAGNAHTAGADDFTITDPNGWQITTIRANGNYSGAIPAGPASSVNIYIIGNSGSNLPDTTNLSAGAIYAAENLAYSDPGSGDIQVTLPGSGVSLPPGTYWLVVQANVAFTAVGQWNWTESSLTPNSGTTLGNESAWFQSAALVNSPISGSPECVGAWGTRVTGCQLTRNPDTNPPADRDLSFQIDGNIIAPPSFTKAFSPASITTGGTSTLTFTLDNSSGASSGTALDFTDNLPAATSIAVPANASTTCTGGTLTSVSGTSVVSYTGGSVAAFASCTVSVDITSSTAGNHVNVTGDLTSSLGNSGTAVDTLTVIGIIPPVFSKVFSPNPIAIGGTSTLTFTLDNTAEASPATALDFTDNLPAAVSVSTPSNAATTCTGGTLTAASGTSVISYTGGSVAASASCTISVDVTSSTAGNHASITGDLTSSLGNSGNATDILAVLAPPSPPLPPAQPVPTISLWGLGFLTGLLGVFGFRRRRN